MSLNHESSVMFQTNGKPTVTWTRVRKPQGSKKRQFLCRGVMVAFTFIVALLVLGLILSLMFSLNDKTANRRDTVRKMTREAWQAYVKHAWGDSALQEGSIKDNYNSGLTIVESLSTLWLMDLKEEFSQGRNWVKKTFLSRADLTKGSPYPQFKVSLMVQRYLGSLLSSYALTDDSLFLEMAKKLSAYLEPAFKDKIIWYLRFLKYSQADNFQHPLIFKADEDQSTFEAGGQTLELGYLNHLIESDQTRSSSPFWGKPLKVTRQYSAIFVKTLPKLVIDGMGPNKIFSLQNEDTRIFYSYFVKSFLQSNASDTQALDLFMGSLKDAKKASLFVHSSSGLLFMRDQRHDSPHSETMEFAGCNWGAILGLASVAVKRAATSDNKYTRAQADRLLQMGKDIVKTCQVAAKMREEGLTPKEMKFPIEESGDLTVDKNGDILLSPELAESLFVLWRVTGDEAYREYAWQMVTAIRDKTRDTEKGGFRNVESTRRQDPSLIGGTFKYLYLIFSDDETLLPLDKWVFNAVGQPLPIFAFIY